jgi:hypothetical protein
VASLYGKHGVPLPDPQEADAKAAQCRARPAEERAAHRNVLICRPAVEVQQRGKPDRPL